MEKSFETAEEVYEEGKSKAKDGYSKAQRKIDDLINNTKDTANKSWDDLKEYCEDHPAQAMGIALATGALLGVTLTRIFSRQDIGVERKIRNAVHTGQETWDQVKDGFEQAVSGLKGAFEAFKK